jgi:hypothetical protein
MAGAATAAPALDFLMACDWGAAYCRARSDTVSSLDSLGCGKVPMFRRALLSLLTINLLLLAACGADEPSATPTATQPAAGTTPSVVAPTATLTSAPPETNAIVVSKRPDPPSGAPSRFCVRYANLSTGTQHETCKDLPQASGTPNPESTAAFDAIIQCWATAEPGKVIPECWR